nr:helix-turn-helix transcriptional regulator [uncultured Trichococcus sp.]
MSLVGNIKQLCSGRGITIAELERRVGISNGQIRKWDTSTPGLDKVKLVADYFGVSVDYLINGGHQSRFVETDLAKMVDNAMSFDGKPIDEHDREVILAFLKGKYGVG